MRSSRTIHTVSCHAEGEVGDVIVGGVSPPPSQSLWEMRSWIAEDDTLRQFMLNEPRGGVFRHVNLLVPPTDPQADAAWIIMEPADTPPMSGSNAMCVTTVLLETGILELKEPITALTLQAPGGLIDVTAHCRDGKVTKVGLKNVPCFVDKLDAMVEVDGVGSLTVDTAYGGDSFAIVDAHALGFSLVPDEARDIADLGVKISTAATEQLGFDHPENPEWQHISFCQMAAPIVHDNGVAIGRNAVAIRPGKIDRSPCGTGVCARMAVLHSRGKMKVGDSFIGESIIGSQFTGAICEQVSVGAKSAIVPTIAGQAWITGTHQHLLDPTDPWPTGYRIADTWPLPKQ